MHRLAERCDGAVAFKYFEPSDDLDPDNLITVSDDDDLQVPPSPSASIPACRCSPLAIADLQLRRL